MSGGSLNYLYANVRELRGQMCDPEMDEFVEDFSKVLHDLEWYQCADYSESTYRETLAAFKAKWFSGEARDDRLTEIIDRKVKELRESLVEMIGQGAQPRKKNNPLDDINPPRIPPGIVPHGKR